MEESTCLAKLIDISNGSEIFIKKVIFIKIIFLNLKKIPCVLGISSNTYNINYKQKKSAIGKTIDIDLNYCNLSEINDYFVKQKLIIENCKRM